MPPAPTSSPEIEAVLAGWRLCGLPFDDTPRLLRALPGGRTNDSYLIRADGERYVLRLGAPDVAALGIDREREALTLAAAARAGLAPGMRWVDPVRGWLLTRFVDGEQRAARTLDEASLDALLGRLERVHELNVDRVPLDYREHYLGFWRRGGMVGALPQSVGRRLAQLESACDTGLVHHDPGPGNVIFADGGPMLVDWEYAACGYPVFDFATVVVDWEIDASRVAASTRTPPALLEDACALYVDLCSWWDRTRRRRSGPY